MEAELRRLRPISEIYRWHFQNGRRERMFLSSVAFFLTFGAVRILTHAIRAHRGPFHNLSAGKVHIHHAVWGILSLLLVGYLWDAQIGTSPQQGRATEATALLYGFGSALTLDEFALWLNLKDVYWTPAGRESIDAVVLFGGILSSALWGAPFWRDVVHEISRLRSPRQVAQLAH